MKCQKNVKNAHLNFPEPNVMSLYCLFCLNNSPKHKDFPFISKNDRKAANLHI